MGDLAEAKGLPPPRISQEKIDRLLKALEADSNTAGVGSSQLPQTLTGRDILIPSFGGVAFYEGELCPEVRSKPGSSNKQEKEEIVYISTAETPTKKKSARKSQENQLVDDKDVAEVGLSEAIEWLRMYSSGDKKSPTKIGSNAATTSKHRPSSAKKAEAKTSKQARSHKPYEASTGPMFNINEEYSADGTRIVGEAVNLSTRLKAVYGDDNPENFNGTAEGEDPTEEEENLEKVAPQKVSDDEFDRISKRLEELALMEEEENKRIKEGRAKPAKPLGGGGSRAKSKAKSNSSFGFQKGFLNKKKPAKVKAAKPKNQASKDSKPPATGGVTIDVSQNKVHEIPREGRQQPVPSRKPQYQTSVEKSTNSNRLLDSSVFSGQISERRGPIGASVNNSGVISKDVAARVAANEQTQSLQYELDQQQQQRQARPKRVSRFRQQRQQEQQQR